MPGMPGVLFNTTIENLFLVLTTTNTKLLLYKKMKGKKKLYVFDKSSVHRSVAVKGGTNLRVNTTKNYLLFL